jgi:hypothetical protein
MAAALLRPQGFDAKRHVRQGGHADGRGGGGGSDDDDDNDDDGDDASGGVRAAGFTARHAEGDFDTFPKPARRKTRPTTRKPGHGGERGGGGGGDDDEAFLEASGPGGGGGGAAAGLGALRSLTAWRRSALPLVALQRRLLGLLRKLKALSLDDMAARLAAQEVVATRAELVGAQAGSGRGCGRGQPGVPDGAARGAALRRRVRELGVLEEGLARCLAGDLDLAAWGNTPRSSAGDHLGEESGHFAGNQNRDGDPEGQLALLRGSSSGAASALAVTAATAHTAAQGALMALPAGTAAAAPAVTYRVTLGNGDALDGATALPLGSGGGDTSVGGGGDLSAFLGLTRAARRAERRRVAGERREWALVSGLGAEVAAVERARKARLQKERREAADRRAEALEAKEDAADALAAGNHLPSSCGAGVSFGKAGRFPQGPPARHSSVFVDF